MELTHKLTRADKESFPLTLGGLKIDTADNPTLASSGAYFTSTPFNLNAGDTISIVTNLPLHRVTIGGLSYDTVGFQMIATCSSYTAGISCITRASEDENDKTLLTYTATTACVVFIGSRFSDDLAKMRCTIQRNAVVTPIDEPIGFDDLQMTMKRNDYHGMGAEVSLGNLEFYGNAYTTIKNAYDYNIDAIVIYSILADGVAIYSGQVDLTTCSFTKGDYQSVKAKVGEIGDMTTFNNRTGTEIDLTDPTTVDGVMVSSPSWRNIIIPMKHLLYTNKMGEKTNRTIASWTAWGNGDSAPEVLEGEFVLSNVELNEYGVVSNDGVLFAKDENFDTKYGTGTSSHLEWNINVKVGWSNVYIWGSTSVYGEVYLYSGSQMIGRAQLVMNSNTKTSTKAISVYYAADTYATATLKLKYKFWQTGDSYNKVTYTGLYLQVLGGANFKMTMYDNLADTNVSADMLLVHDALSLVSQCISEKALSVKSDWYGYSSSIGGGALKALTNGYHIRGLFTTGDTKRNMPLSFKSLIESLSALDCIGWGFSKESGVLYVRVERWDWFYKDTVVLTLTNVAEVTTEVYPDSIPTELQIGYKKFATQEQYNSIDSPHGTRTFTSCIKALSKAITKESEFVADNYAIEETRRARTQVNETEETTYDENIFVFELFGFKPSGGSIVLDSLQIAHSATNATNIGRASEFINAKLTPRHMASRWRSFVFAANNNTPLRFTSGEINYKGSFGVKPTSESATGGDYFYLQSYEEASPQVENADISYVHAKFKAEKIKFQYPLTIAQYQAVKANQYGLISVNGVQGWILDFKYSFYDGLADFTLIAKYTS